MAEAAIQPPAAGTRSWRWVALPVFLGAGVALLAGLLADHSPRSKGYFRLVFEDPIHLKAAFATAAAVLACFQVVTAAWIFRKLPWSKPAWVNPAHRWSGRLAFVCTLPVAYHCIFKLGFQHPDTRVFAHALLGCAVYGAFAAKVTIVRLHRFPRPVLPVAGALLFATLVGVWATSSLWLYTKSTPTGQASPIPADANAAAGSRVYASAGCGGCHTLAAAKSTGSVGPNLDTLRPGFEQVRAQVEHGGGAMPSYRTMLSPAQIRDVSAFVAEHAGR